MTRLLLMLGCVLAPAAVAQPVKAITVSIDTTAARAMLNALHDTQLTTTQAYALVRLPGNQGIVRKLKEFGLPVSDASFAKAVYDTAHGQSFGDPVEKDYFLDIVTAHADETGRLLDGIDKDPNGFRKAIEERIALFTPKDANIHLSGYVVAGGDGGGYAFNGTDFYLNIGLIREALLARNVTTHEMFHAVQGAFAKDRGMASETNGDTTCGHLRRLFDSLFREGTAMVVEDQSLVERSTAEIAARKRTDMADNLRQIRGGFAMLEMAVDALQATPPTPFEDVYAVGFYGHGTLYSVGFVMARDIAEQSGPQAIAGLLKQPAYSFLLTYTHLTKYGSNADYPKLGPNTIAAAEQLRAGCH